MLRVTMIGIMAVFLAVLLKKDKAEFSMLVILGACILLMALALGKVEGVLTMVHQMESRLGDNSLYVGILLKIVGITYVTELGANLCSDAGYHAVANQIEFYGKIMIMAVSVPIIMNLMDTIGKI